MRKKKRSKHVSKDEKRGLKRKLMEIAGGQTCAVCGYETDVLAVYEFHHVMPRSKKFAIGSRAMCEKNYAELADEAGKCIVLCCRCHRILHWTE